MLNPNRREGPTVGASLSIRDGRIFAQGFPTPAIAVVASRVFQKLQADGVADVTLGRAGVTILAPRRGHAAEDIAKLVQGELDTMTRGVGNARQQ